LLAGLGLGLSLIVAIGAQNLFVLRQGIRRQHAVAVALVCALSDAALIALGVSGLGALLHAVPWLIDAVRWAGAAFLTVYAALAARRCAAEARRSTPRHPQPRPICLRARPPGPRPARARHRASRRCCSPVSR
jgi:L-lysine exporter family protein LysE/ArgO